MSDGPPPPPGFPPPPPPAGPPPGYPPGPPVYPPGPPVSPPVSPAVSGPWYPGAAPAWVPVPQDPLVARDGFGSWFTKIVDAVRRSWRRLVPLFLVAAAPQAVIAGFLGRSLGSRGVNRIVTTETGVDGRAVLHVDWSLARPLIVAVIVSLTLGAVISVLVRAAAVWTITHDAAGQPTTFGEAVGFAARRFWALIGWQLVFGVAILAGLVLCVAPGVYVWVLSTFVAGVVCFERGDVWGRCRALLAGHFWPVFGRVAVLALLTGVLSQVGTLIGNVVTGATGNAAFGGVVGAFVNAPIAMIAAAAAIVTYAEAKARIDGIDTPNLLYDLHRP